MFAYINGIRTQNSKKALRSSIKSSHVNGTIPFLSPETNCRLREGRWELWGVDVAQTISLNITSATFLTAKLTKISNSSFSPNF